MLTLAQVSRIVMSTFMYFHKNNEVLWDENFGRTLFKILNWDPEQWRTLDPCDPFCTDPTSYLRDDAGETGSCLAGKIGSLHRKLLRKKLGICVKNNVFTDAEACTMYNVLWDNTIVYHIPRIVRWLIDYVQSSDENVVTIETVRLIAHERRHEVQTVIWGGIPIQQLFYLPYKERPWEIDAMAFADVVVRGK